MMHLRCDIRSDDVRSSLIRDRFGGMLSINVGRMGEDIMVKKSVLGKCLGK